jgi:hypothetical protein
LPTEKWPEKEPLVRLEFAHDEEVYRNTVEEPNTKMVANGLPAKKGAANGLAHKFTSSFNSGRRKTKKLQKKKKEHEYESATFAEMVSESSQRENSYTK